MLKYLMKLRSRKAFTLVELVIAMAILALLMVSVAAFSTPVQQMVKATASDADSITINKVMGDYIETRLGFADKLTALHAVYAETPDSNVTGTWTTYQNRLNGAEADPKDKAGVLIINYEANPDEPYLSTYQIYDIVIPKTGSYNGVVLDGSNIDDEHAVYIDQFYGNTQNLILVPTELTANKARGSSYMSIDIVSYDCNDDYPDDYIKASTISDYYDYKLKREQTPALYPDESCGLDAIKHVKSGAIETITFEVQNLNPKNISTNWSTPCPGGAGGSDIMIFYYIPHY